MAQPDKTAPPEAPDLLTVRVLSEILGSWRAPEARRGDIIKVTREDYEKHGPRVLQDIAEEERAKAAELQPRVDPWFQQQREALRAEREASMTARVAMAEREAKAAADRAKALQEFAQGKKR